MRAWRTPAALALAVALGQPAAVPAHAAGTPPALVSDATGPLFTAVALVPGAPLERCLRLTWSGAAGTTLGVSARVVGGLAPYLDATVQAGTGGGFDGCGGFVPDGAGWSGTLAGLTADHGEPARQARLVVADHAGSTTVRITVAVQDDNRAQALRATGDLVFALVTGTTVPDPGPTPEPTPGPTPEPTPDAVPTPTPDPSPAPAPTSAPEPSPAVPPAASPSAGDAATPRPAPVAPVPSDAPDTTEGDPAEQDPGGGPSSRPTPDVQATITIPLAPGGPTDAPEPSWLQHALSRWLDAAGESAGAVSRAVGWTFWTAPLVILFLLVQNRIDARDPKLAEAPAEAVPGLLFDETYDVAPGDGPVAPGGAP